MPLPGPTKTRRRLAFSVFSAVSVQPGFFWGGAFGAAARVICCLNFRQSANQYFGMASVSAKDAPLNERGFLLTEDEGNLPTLIQAAEILPSQMKIAKVTPPACPKLLPKLEKMFRYKPAPRYQAKARRKNANGKRVLPPPLNLQSTRQG